MFPRLYLYIALAVAGLSIVGVIYGKGRVDASHAAEMTRVNLELTKANYRIAAETKARSADTQLASEAAKRQSGLEFKIEGLEDYAHTLEGDLRGCLDGRDVDQLRQLWP